MSALPDLSKLTAGLPSNAFSFDGGNAYSIDGLTPSVVVKPSSQSEVAATLKAAGAAGAAVIPFGAGTQQSLGMPPQRYDVALDLRRIDRLVEHEPADLTVTVEAGMRLASLQEVLGKRGQWLTLDPPVAEDATIGGILATNASGPARLSRGTARDLVIGMTVATAQGELVKSGGRVVKNVAGYDLAKLHIGGLGTAGVILQVSFKVAPLPVRIASCAVQGDLDALLRVSNAVQHARLAVQGCVLSRREDAARWTLGLRFAAGEAAVERSLREANGIAAPLGLAVATASEEDWRALLPSYGDSTVVARAGVLDSALGSLAESLSSAGATVSAFPGSGIAYAAWPAGVDTERLRLLRQMAESKQGALVIEKAPLETRAAIDVWGSPRGDFALMRRLKQEMDPSNVLNPGRFVGGI